MNEDPAASILTVQVPIQESHLEEQVRGDMAEALAVKAEGICVPTFFKFGEDCRQSGRAPMSHPGGNRPIWNHAGMTATSILAIRSGVLIPFTQ